MQNIDLAAYVLADTEALKDKLMQMLMHLPEEERWALLLTTNA